MNNLIETGLGQVNIDDAGNVAALIKSTDKVQRRAAGNIFKFLALLLVLTLIARGTNGATLARVTTADPSRGNIVDSVDGNAVVLSRNTLEIFAPEGLTIAEVLVGDGQSVKYGDALARFYGDEVREKLEREKAGLEKMLLDLEKLERSEPADVSSLESAGRTLRRAQEDYENTKTAGEDSIAVALDALDEAINEIADDPDASAIATALRNLQRAQEDYENTISQGASEITAALESLEAAKNGQTSYVDYSSIDSAQRNLQRAQQDYDSVRAEGDAEIAAAKAFLDALEAEQGGKSGSGDEGDTGDEGGSGEAGEAGDTAEIIQARAALAAALKRADENLLAARRRVEDATAALNKADGDYYRTSQQTAEAKQAEIDRALSALESAQKKAEENQISARRRIEDAETALSKAENDYERSEQQVSDSRMNEIDRARSALESAQQKAEENLLSARRRVEDAEASLRKIEDDYQKSARQANDNSAQNSVSAISLRLDINAQKSIIDALEALINNDCLFYSDMEGIVSSSMTEGNVTGKTPLVSFRDGAKGFEAQMRIKKDDADKLAVGDECEVTTGGGSMYYNPTVTGTISGISPPDENDMVTITIRLPGSDWDDGQRVEAQVVLNSGNYDFCVPLSALRSDNTGYFLYIVEQQSSVLGLQNTVMRVNVDLVAADTYLASVRGPVERNSPVITGSNKTVTAGDRVRVE